MGGPGYLLPGRARIHFERAGSVGSRLRATYNGAIFQNSVILSEGERTISFSHTILAEPQPKDLATFPIQF